MEKNQLKRNYHCHFISNNAGDDDHNKLIIGGLTSNFLIDLYNTSFFLNLDTQFRWPNSYIGVESPSPPPPLSTTQDIPLTSLFGNKLKK